VRRKGWRDRFVLYISDMPFFLQKPIRQQMVALCAMIHEVDPQDSDLALGRGDRRQRRGRLRLGLQRLLAPGWGPFIVPLHYRPISTTMHKERDDIVVGTTHSNRGDSP
jgi:hypothetical protein